MILLNNHRSLLGRWWWTVDRASFFILIAILSLGIVLNFAATPSIAHRLGCDTFYFVKRHLLYLVPVLLILMSVSSLNFIQIKKLSLVVLAVALFLLVLTPFIGTEVKGAKRWLMLCGISFQVSEFIKPSFSVISGWLLSKQFQDHRFPGLISSIGLVLFIVFFLLMQPDLGMTVVLLTSWFCQLFVAGIPYLWVFLAGAFMCTTLFVSYWVFPHVAKRIDVFLFASDSDIYGQHYQITRSLEAFAKGGIFGKGPGEGTVKNYVPDAHSDFIFAVAGEEFGLLFCLLIIALFIAFTYRTMQRMYHTQSFMGIIAAVGLLSQLILQSLVNMASTLNIIPTKGMTLPFISYGGSSMIALALSCSMLLSLTSKHMNTEQ